MNDFDDDIEELFYAPLKRKKMGHESIKNSQVTYSSVQSQIYPKRSSRSQSQNKRNLSQTSKNSKLKKNNQHIKVNSKPPVLFKEPVNIKSYLKSNPSQNTKLTSSKTERSEKNLKNAKCEESPDIEILNFNNNNNNNNKNNNNKNIFEDDTPDIDFTQINDTDSSHFFDSKGQPSPDTLNEKEDLDEEKFFCDKELVIQEDCNKVDSWLVKSIQENDISLKEEDAKWDGDDSTEENKNPDRVINENSHKTCVHLHFHVNSPQKFIQPTLEHFFKKSSTCSADVIKSEEAKFKKNDSNSVEVLNCWQNIMKPSTRSKAGPSGISQSSSNFKKETEVTQKSNKKTCPYYKIIEDTSFVVDGFNYGHIDGISYYFLSHFHYDHYIGLSKHFKRTIYCSQITANLVRLKLNVEERFIKPLPLEEPRVIDGVEVTLYDANHCPGSVMFLFKLTSGKVILHVGDFRHHLDMESISDFWNNPIDLLYLDTTYLDPCYNFLSQDEILEKCKSIAEEHTMFTKNTLFVVGSYTIGKEKVFKAIASKLDCKIYAQPYKERILRCLNDPEINNRLTKDKIKAQVHVIGMRDLSLCKLKKYMEDMQNTFKALVAVRPTGWEHNSDVERNLSKLKPKQTGNIYVYGLPYSEHSSYSELRRFYQFIQPSRTIPTVNNSKESRLKMEKIFKDWKLKSASTFSKR